jgi:hypothetical protein
MTRLSGVVAVVAVVASITTSHADVVDEGTAIQQLLIETILSAKPAWHGYSADSVCVLLGELKWKEFVLVPQEGPTELFLSRLTSHGMTLLPGPACQMIKRTSGPGVVVRESSRPAFFITVSRLKLTGSNKAEAQAGIICGAMCGSSMTYHLVKRDGRWAVVRTSNHMVS